MENEEKTVEETSVDEKQYADFSDMGKSEIPDEIDETPAEGEQAIQYYEEETQKETAEVETPEETPETNTKGEELTPTQESYWQHKYDTEVKPLQEQNKVLQQEFEAIKTQINPPVKEEVLVEPVKPKVPFLDDPQAWDDYRENKSLFDNKTHQKEMGEMRGVVKQFQDVLATQAETDKANQLKSYNLGKLQTVGKLTPEESVDAINMLSNPNQTEEEYFEYIADYYKFRKGKSTPSKSINTSKTPKPLAIQQGETQEVKVNDDDQFFGDMKQFIDKNF